MKANNYGDLFAFVTGKPLVTYVTFGSYQGEYIVVLDDGDDLLLFKGYYGSCSVCDWLEGHIEWRTKEVDEAKVREAFEKEAEHPFAIIAKEVAVRVDSRTFSAFLPKNVRQEIYEFDGERLHKEVVAALQKH